MGVRGLTRHCSENETSFDTVDLLEIGKRFKENGQADSNGRAVLAVDFLSFATSFLKQCEDAVQNAQSPDSLVISPHVRILGGEPGLYDHWVSSLVRNLRERDIELLLFVDGPRGGHQDELRRKLATLRERGQSYAEAARDVMQFCSSGRKYSKTNVWTGISLADKQLLCTALRLGVRWVQCLGEADEEIAHYAQTHQEVFAIVSTDSDFFITPGCRVINPDFVSWIALCGETIDDHGQFDVGVFSPAMIARSLEMPESCLPSLAALAGNDITGPLLEAHHVHARMGLKRVYVKVLRDELANVEDYDIRNIPVVRQLMEEDSTFADAINSSLQFYSADYSAKKLTWSLSEKNRHPLPEKFLSFLLQAVVAVKDGLRMKRALSVACNGVSWRFSWLEDLNIGKPRIMSLTSELRKFMYGILRQEQVMEYGRTDTEDFDVEELVMEERHFATPLADEVFSLSVHDRVAWYWKIACVYLTPGLTLDEFLQDAIAPLKAVHAEPGEEDRVVVQTLLVAGVLRCLISLNGLMKSKAQRKCHLKGTEIDSLVAMWFALQQGPATQSLFRPPSQRPSSRCVTVGQWFLAVMSHCENLASLLGLSDFFPEMRHLFSGSLWAAIFSAGEAGEKASGSRSSPTVTTMRDRLQLLSSPTCSVVRQFVYHDLPSNVLEVTSPPTVPVQPREIPSPPVVESQSRPSAPQTSGDAVVLPIAEHRPRILQQIRSERITCIQGETGCGKSTSVPLYILEDHLQQCSGKGQAAQQLNQLNIVVTQPRRVAAIMLARHVASLLGEAVGQTVGYKVSRDLNASRSTRITYMTIGYLLQVLVNEPSAFKNFSHLVLDEVHERSADADLLSLVIRRLMHRYEGPKLVIMSATLQADLFADYFVEVLNTAEEDETDCAHSPALVPTLFVGVKRFDVKAVFLEDLASYIARNGSQPSAVKSLTIGVSKALKKFKSAVDRLDQPLRAAVVEPLSTVCVTTILQLSRPGQCILVFVAGLGDILELHEVLSKHVDSHHLRVFGLHSLMPRDEQEEAFKVPPSDTCHVILATNIAESSLTLPEVSLVIDFGLQKEIVFDSRSKRCCLVHTWCSQASAKQRAGRTGRVRPGTVVRLFSQPFFDHVMPEYDSPEIVRLPLDKLVLQVRQLGDALARDGDECPAPSQLLQEAVQPPSTAQLHAAVESLAEVGALTAPDERADITWLGRIGLNLPVDLSIARFLLICTVLGYAGDGVIVAAGLSTPLDVFSMPSHLVMGIGAEYVASLWRSVKTRFHFDSRQCSEPLMVWSLFREWLRFRRSSAQKLKASEPFKRNVVAQKFCAVHAVSWQRLLTLESLVADIASRLLSALPRDHAAAGSLAWLSSLSHQRGTTVTGSQLDMADPDQCLSDDVEGLRCALVASFSFNILSADGTDITDSKGGPAQLKRQRRDTTDVLKSHFVPSRTVVASNVPKHLRHDGGKALKAALPSVVGENARVFLASDKAFIECAEDSDNEETSGGSGQLEGLSKRGHLLCQLGGGRNRCFLAPNATEKDPKTGALFVPVPSSDMDGSTAADNCLTINKRNQPCRVGWRLVSGKGATEVNCYWRNPIGHARTSSAFAGQTEDSYAVAASIQGTERPDVVSASGVTVLPTELDGFLAQFLLFLFVPHCQRVDFHVHRDNGDVQALRMANLRLHFEPPLPQSLVTQVSKLREDISMSLDRVTDRWSEANDLQRELKSLLQAVRNVATGHAQDDDEDSSQLSRRMQRKARRRDRHSWTWVPAHQPGRKAAFLPMLDEEEEETESETKQPSFLLLPPFKLLNQLDKETPAANGHHQRAPDNGTAGIDVQKCLKNLEFCLFVLSLYEIIEDYGGVVELDELRHIADLKFLAGHARSSLGLPKSVNLLSKEFLAKIPGCVDVRTIRRVCTVRKPAKIPPMLQKHLANFLGLDGLSDDSPDSLDSSDWHTCSEGDSSFSGDEAETETSSSSLEKSMGRLSLSSAQLSANGAHQKCRTPGKKLKTTASDSDETDPPTEPQSPQCASTPTSRGKTPVSTKAKSNAGTVAAKESLSTSAKKKRKEKKKKTDVSARCLEFAPDEVHGFLGKNTQRKLRQHIPDLLEELKSTVVAACLEHCHEDLDSVGADLYDIMSDPCVRLCVIEIEEAMTCLPNIKENVFPLTPVFLRSMFGPDIRCRQRRMQWVVEVDDEYLGYMYGDDDGPFLDGFFGFAPHEAYHLLEQLDDDFALDGIPCSCGSCGPAHGGAKGTSSSNPALGFGPGFQEGPRKNVKNGRSYNSTPRKGQSKVSDDLRPLASANKSKKSGSLGSCPSPALSGFRQQGENALGTAGHAASPFSSPAKAKCSSTPVKKSPKKSAKSDLSHQPAAATTQTPVASAKPVVAHPKSSPASAAPAASAQPSAAQAAKQPSSLAKSKSSTPAKKQPTGVAGDARKDKSTPISVLKTDQLPSRTASCPQPGTPSKSASKGARPSSSSTETPKRKAASSGGLGTPSGKKVAGQSPAASRDVSSHKPQPSLDEFVHVTVCCIKDHGGAMSLSQLCGLPHLRQIALRKPFVSKHGQVLKLKFFEKQSRHFLVQRRDNGEVYISVAEH